jgi:hypothetical protein
MKPVTDTEILQHIQNWAEYVASTKTSNGWPICPYARRALIKNRLKIFEYDPASVDEVVALFRADTNTFKVWVLIGSDDVEKQAVKLNQLYDDIWWLYDFAAASLEIDGVQTGNKKYDIILMQDKVELVDKSNVLKSSGYYSNWSEENIQLIVDTRLVKTNY